MTLRVRRLSPAGRGALAVLSVEGPGALEALAALAGGRRPRPGRPTLARLAHGGREIDEALLLAAGPERVELYLHGSPALVAQIARALAPERGLEPPAGSGGSLEQRAGLLLESAASEAAARILLDQAEGALRRELESIRGLDPAGQVARLTALARLGRSLASVLRPPLVVLAGPVNAGKSTLFNALVGRRRVVTSDEPGTTRDAVTERARLGDLVVDLVDTAGERAVPPAVGAAAGEVESRGQVLGRALRRSADLVLWLQPADGPRGPAPGPVATGRPRVVLVSRAAGLAPAARGPFHLAALEDPAGAAAVVARAAAAALSWPAQPWVPGRAVPFDPELAARLAGLARARGAARAGGLAELLGDPGARGEDFGPGR